jgi:hypothetical protein
VTGTRRYGPAVTGHASRRIRILGATPPPAASWVPRAATNHVADLEDAGSRARFLIRDRGGKVPGLPDAVLSDAGIEVVLSGVQMPGMNAVTQRWVQTCRRELLDRTLIWTQRHRTPCASSGSSTIPAGLTRESPAPGHGVRCPHRSPS